MGISLRDEKGQGVVEYVLVLVVSIAIVLGFLHQFNTAFKKWSDNYFGNYIACLLETGELPAISGSPGDSGVCGKLFKPFTLADGFKLRTDVKATNSSNNNAGTRGGGGSTSHGGGGGAVTGGGGGRFAASSSPPISLGGKGRGGTKGSSAYTGSTAVNRDATGYTTSASRYTPIKTRLDTTFAFEQERERSQRQSITPLPPRPFEMGENKTRIPLTFKPPKAKVDDADSSNFTISNFIRILIIAAIIIALVMFLGGQALQIGKSMDSSG